MKHSLGPYRFEGNKIVCAAGYNVATVNSHATSEGRATGALLAAAPDMLEALKQIAEPLDTSTCCGDPWAFYRDLQAVALSAINKI